MQAKLALKGTVPVSHPSERRQKETVFTNDDAELHDNDVQRATYSASQRYSLFLLYYVKHIQMINMAVCVKLDIE